MAYISYKDVPLYFSASANTNALPTTSNNSAVFCQQVQLNYTPNIAPVRLLGKTPTRDNFNLAGPPNSSLSFSCYVDSSEFDPNNYTGDVDVLNNGNGATFRLGDDTNGIKGSGAFLTSFSYTLAPYAPVLVQCDFAIYNPLAISNPGGKIVAETSSAIPNLNFANYGHGAYSVFSGINGNTASATLGNDINTFESVQYQFSANRLPVYEIGSYTPSVVELITAEHSLTIQGDNITELVPITGSNPGQLQLQIKNSSSTTLFTSSVNGRITAENVSIQGGDLARGNITITELLK